MKTVSEWTQAAVFLLVAVAADILIFFLGLVIYRAIVRLGGIRGIILAILGKISDR